MNKVNAGSRASFIDLQLFAEGGEGGSTGGEGFSGVNAAPGQQSNWAYEGSTPTGRNESPDRSAEFESLIKGDYKAEYDRRVAETVQKRLKSSKETVDKFEKLSPVLEMLSNRYNVDVTDIDALTNAINEDDSYYEDEALERGMSVKQLKDFKKMERQNKALLRAQQEREAEEKAHRDVEMWVQQAEAAKAIFPNLDLRQELDNPDFVELLQRGYDVKKAYTAAHIDEIMGSAMQQAANSAREQTVNSIKANGMRPSENGLKGVSTARTVSDMSTSTKEQRAALAKALRESGVPINLT